MKARYIIATSVAVAALLFGMWIRSDAAMKYQIKDKNVASGKVMQWSFDSDKAGSVPPGADVFSGTWVIRRESDAPSGPNVLCQTGEASFPALSLGDKIFTDATISTRFKPISGNADRAAGIIFRIQDSDNFYILRANALEDNVNIYKYVNGSRRDVKEGSAKVPSNRWQELRVEVRGNDIRGYLDGKQAVEARDDTFKAGKIGLWTKADSVTCFDDVKATAR